MPTKKQTRAAKAPKSRTASRRCAVSTGSAILPVGARILNDVDTGWVDLPSGGRMRLKIKQVEW